MWAPLAAALRHQNNLNSQIVSSGGSGGTFVTNITTSFRNDEARWLIGLPERTVVNTTPTLYNQEARTTSSAYDEATGLR